MGLDAGNSVVIVELTHPEADGVVRACIREPPGWLSLVNTKTGERWAVRDDAATTEELSGVVSELHAKLAEIKAREARQQTDLQKDEELRIRLKEELAAHDNREKELQAQMEALKTVQESMALDSAALEAKREQQH